MRIFWLEGFGEVKEMAEDKRKIIFEKKGISLVAMEELPKAERGIKKPEYDELIDAFVESGEACAVVEGLEKKVRGTLKSKAEGKPVKVVVRQGKIWLERAEEQKGEGAKPRSRAKR